MIAKAKLFLLLGISVGAFWGGWWVNGWRHEANQLEAVQSALLAQTAEFEKVLSEYADRIEVEAAESIALEKQLKAKKEHLAELQEVIANATFTTEVVDGCKSHSVDSPEFVRLLTCAGRAECGASRDNPDGVSPRDD